MISAIVMLMMNGVTFAQDHSACFSVLPEIPQDSPFYFDNRGQVRTRPASGGTSIKQMNTQGISRSAEFTMTEQVYGGKEKAEYRISALYGKGDIPTQIAITRNGMRTVYEFLVFNGVCRIERISRQPAGQPEGHVIYDHSICTLQETSAPNAVAVLIENNRKVNRGFALETESRGVYSYQPMNAELLRTGDNYAALGRQCRQRQSSLAAPAPRRRLPGGNGSAGERTN